MKEPVTSVVTEINCFEVFLSASVADCLVGSRSFWLYIALKFLLIFLPNP